MDNNPQNDSSETDTGLITVRVTGQPICEDGEHYLKGATFETTPERAAALASLVSIVDAPV